MVRKSSKTSKVRSDGMRDPADHRPRLEATVNGTDRVEVPWMARVSVAYLRQDRHA